MIINTKQDFLEEFIQVSTKLGVNMTTVENVSKKIYNHRGGYVIDFYHGIADIIREIEKLQDSLIDQNSQIKETKSITEKIRLSLYQRVTGLDPDFAYQLHKYYKTIKGIQIFTEVKFRTCDYIWRIAGDKSLDFNYYSKRALLFMVYTQSSRVFATSKNIDDAKRAIDSGLSRVLKLSKCKPSLILEKIPFIRLLIK